MTRLERKKKLGKLWFKSSGGLLDAFDGAVRDLYHLTDEMYDDFLGQASPEEMNYVLDLLPMVNSPKVTYTQAKNALISINKYC